MQHSKRQKMLTTAMMFSLSSIDLNIKSALKSFIAIYDYVWLSNMKEYINLRWDSWEICLMWGTNVLQGLSTQESKPSLPLRPLCSSGRPSTSRPGPVFLPSSRGRWRDWTSWLVWGWSSCCLWRMGYPGYRPLSAELVSGWGSTHEISVQFQWWVWGWNY